MLLSDLPWIWCGPLPQDGPPPPGSRAVAPDARDLATALAEIAAPACVVVPPRVRPAADSGALSPEPPVVEAATAAGRALMWPSVNDLTGGCASQTGLFLVPRGHGPDGSTEALAHGLLADNPAVRLGAVVLPCLAATWECGVTPEMAFRSGHAAMIAPPDEDRVLVAALGADRPNGLWWGIGAARALLEDPVEAAWDDERALAEGRADPARRRADLARQVRVRRGLPLYPLDPEAAAALRAMRTPVAPAALWDRHLRDLADLGPLGAADLSDHMAFTRTLLWGAG